MTMCQQTNKVLIFQAQLELTCHKGYIVVLITGLSDSAFHTLICDAACQDEILLLQAAQNVIHIGGGED